MKKNLAILFILLCPCGLMAQNWSNADRAIIAGRIDTLLIDYMQKSGLKLPGENKRNDKVVGDLRTMIAIDAEVFDDINAEYNEKKQQYVLKLKSRNDYIEDLIEAFPKGLLINNRNLNVSYSRMNENIVTAVLARNVQGTNSGKFTFVNEDTLLIKVRINPDMTVKISEISSLGSHLRCLNDDDTDGVTDDNDECRNASGLIALSGCPDNDGDGIPNYKDNCPNEKGDVANGGCAPSTFPYQFVFSASVGYLFNRVNLEKLKSGDLGYESVDDKNSNFDNGKIFNPTERTSTLGLNAHIAYYFGKNKFNKSVGISLGVGFSRYLEGAEYGLDGIKYVYKAIDSDGDAYHQILTFNTSAKEKITYNFLNLPLMLRYKKKFGSLAAEVSLGPSFLITRVSSKFVGTYNLEAIYEYKINNDKGDLEYSPIYEHDIHDWIIMKDTMNLFTGNGNTPNGADEIENLAAAGYNVGLNIEPKNKGESAGRKTRTAIAGNISLDLFYHVGPKVAVKVGGSFIYAKLKNKNADDGYQTFSKNKDDEFSSLLNSSVNANYTAYGFNIGLIIGLNVNKK